MLSWRTLHIMGSQALGLPGKSVDPSNCCPPLSVQWEPVQYFNNKIICDLVEEKFKGIISILVRSLLF